MKMDPQVLTDAIECLIKKLFYINKKGNNKKDEIPLASPVIEENNVITYPMAKSA